MSLIWELLGRLRGGVALVVALIIVAMVMRDNGYAQSCGDTLVGSVTLGADLSCPTGHGLILSDGASLDCNGRVITGADQAERYGLYVRDASDTAIRNCTVEHFEIGIRLRGSADSVVRNNFIQHNTRYGIEVTQSSTGALIEGNDIVANGDEGIHLSGPLDRDAQHRVLGNLVMGNAAEGIYLLESHGNTLADNEVRHNVKGGIYGRASERNTIEGNSLTNDPIQLLFASHRNVVTGNTIASASTGISINGGQNTITQNVVSSSVTDGIGVEGQDNALSCNRVVGNPVGFRFKAGSTPNNVNENVIVGNTVGLDATGLAEDGPAIDARENWWGCVEGPGFPGCDPVEGKVDASLPASVSPACARCISNSDCDDGDLCTDDECNGAGICDHIFDSSNDPSCVAGTTTTTASTATSSSTSSTGTPTTSTSTTTTTLGECVAELAQCRGDLAECLSDPGTAADDDGDSMPDSLDSCPDTPQGLEVDQAGCSLEQFCAAVDLTAWLGSRVCRKADWQNDEPMMRSRERDCTIHQSTAGRDGYRCAPGVE